MSTLDSPSLPAGFSLLQAPNDLGAVLNIDQKGQAQDIPPKAASALALGVAQRMGFLSKHAGAPAEATRLSACVAAMVCQAVLQGQICLPLNLCASRLGLNASTLRAFLLRSKMVCEEAQAVFAPLPLVLDAGDRLYLARYYDYERRLASGLRDLIIHTPAQEAIESMAKEEGGLSHVGQSEPIILQWRETIRHYGDALGLADHQRLAVALTLLNRLTLISGGPGTGKTTTTTGLLACLLKHEPRLRIALAAPTGRAAQHLFHALTNQASRLSADLAARLPQKAFTVHRLVSERTTAHHLASESNKGATSQKYTQKITDTGLLPYDLIIIDEASMLDVVLATQLVESLSPTTRLILLGDKHQLGAVEAGAVFASLTAQSRFTPEYLSTLALLLPNFDFDMQLQRDTHQEAPLHVLLNCSVELTRNYRFAKTSCIGRLARAIREAESQAALAVLKRVTLESLKEPLTAEEGSEQDYAVLIEENPSLLTAPSTQTNKLDAAAFELLAKGFDTYFYALQAVLFKSVEKTTCTDTHTAHVSFAALSAALHTYKVLCPVYEGPRGVGALNAGLDRLFRAKLLCALQQQSTNVSHLSDAACAFMRHMHTDLEKAAYEQSLSLPQEKGGAIQQGFTLYAGLPLMVTRNTYHLDLFNGDIGIVLPRYLVHQIVPSIDDSKEGEQSTLQVLFYKADKSIRVVSPSLLPPCRAAFAMTVHKAQGSEFNQVALVLPSVAAPANRSLALPPTSLTRAMLYTAITRARQKVTLLGSTQAFEAAICTSADFYSGLQARLDTFLLRPS